MAHLAIVGSHSVNGVAALHTDLLKHALIPDFYSLWPEKFNNKTNGITQRRWLLKANSLLSKLISRSIGEEWITDIDKLRSIDSFADDRGFQEEFMRIKQSNKERLAKVIFETIRVKVDPGSFFDIQAKRIHEYKRQLLNVLHIVYQYLSIIEDGQEPSVSRTYIFAGKAAPGYWTAKQTIKLINSLGNIINNDPRVKGFVKVVFIPDYRVSLAEKIIPGADLSEQISTADKEASGTGNMKFALNGALTIGTLDGTNIEIMEEVGKDNIFIFGLKADEIQKAKSNGLYNPSDYYYNNPKIKRVMDSFSSHMFCPEESGLFRWVFDALLSGNDQYFHLADLESYITAQRDVDDCYKNPDVWAKAILNMAYMGKFSSDRTIKEYARDIWGMSSFIA